MKPLEIFDKLSSYLKRLTLDHDLNDEEAGDLAHVADELNDVRERFVDRKIEEIVAEVGPCDSPPSS